jgi:four helix bundle protein
VVAGRPVQEIDCLINRCVMKGHKDLEIFVESKRLAIRIHEMTLNLPKYESYEEGSQLRRSSKSVASLIVEGYGRRRYKADYVKYLVHSHAECDETMLHLDFVFETKSLKDEALYTQLLKEYEALSKRINRFIKWVEGHETFKHNV